MPEKINQYKLKLSSFSCELDGELDRNKRIFLTTEAECFEVASQDNQDGTYNQIFKAKVVGATKVDQKGQKIILGKSKRSPSQRLRMSIMAENPDEEIYERFINKLIIKIQEEGLNWL